MKRKIIAFIVALALVSSVQFLAPVKVTASAKDAGAAALLSAIVPGAGEWYNGNFESAFPWAECIVGHICCCMALSSIVDAANGDSSDKIRHDFWSNPANMTE